MLLQVGSNLNFAVQSRARAHEKVMDISAPL